MTEYWLMFWIYTSSILAITAASQSAKATIKDGGDPEFTSAIGNVTVPLGREAILTCAVTDLGNFRVGWIKVEDQTILTLHTKVVTHSPRIILTHDNNLWQLHIRQVKESDRGCYMCQVNTNIMKNQIGCIDVHVPPDIINEGTSGDVTVSEGDNATLSCRAQGHPMPRILWRRENGEHIILKKSSRGTEKVETFLGEQLTLERVDRKQMGAYLCIASNDVPPAVSKRIILNINFQPTIKGPNQLLGSPLKSDVQIECIAEAFPNTINYWLKNRSEMLLQGNKYFIEESRNLYTVKLKLTVRDLTKNDLGPYTCVATNSLGKTEGTVRLYEIKIPTLPPTTTTSTTVSTTTAVTTEIITTPREGISIIKQPEEFNTSITGSTVENLHDNEIIPHPSSGRRHSDMKFSDYGETAKPIHYLFPFVSISISIFINFS